MLLNKAQFSSVAFVLFFFQAEDGIRYRDVTGVQTCALPIFGDAPGDGEPELGADAVVSGEVVALRRRVAVRDAAARGVVAQQHLGEEAALERERYRR